MLNAHTKGMLGIAGVRFHSNENQPAGRCEWPVSILPVLLGWEEEKGSSMPDWEMVACLDANRKLASSMNTLVHAEFYNTAKGFI